MSNPTPMPPPMSQMTGAERTKLLYHGAIQLAAADLMDADGDAPIPWILHDGCVGDRRQATAVCYATAAFDILEACARKSDRAAEAETAKPAEAEKEGIS